MTTLGEVTRFGRLLDSNVGGRIEEAAILILHENPSDKSQVDRTIEVLLRLGLKEDQIWTQNAKLQKRLVGQKNDIERIYSDFNGQCQIFLTPKLLLSSDNFPEVAKVRELFDIALKRQLTTEDVALSIYNLLLSDNPQDTSQATEKLKAIAMAVRDIRVDNALREKKNCIVHNQGMPYENDLNHLFQRATFNVYDVSRNAFLKRVDPDEGALRLKADHPLLCGRMVRKNVLDPARAYVVVFLERPDEIQQRERSMLAVLRQIPETRDCLLTPYYGKESYPVLRTKCWDKKSYRRAVDEIRGGAEFQDLSRFVTRLKSEPTSEEKERIKALVEKGWLDDIPRENIPILLDKIYAGLKWKIPEQIPEGRQILYDYINQIWLKALGPLAKEHLAARQLALIEKIEESLWARKILVLCNLGDEPTQLYDFLEKIPHVVLDITKQAYTVERKPSSKEDVFRPPI